jgi:hypothetical protein
MSGGNAEAAASVTEREPCQGFLHKFGGLIFKKVAESARIRLRLLVLLGSVVLFGRYTSTILNFDTLCSGRSDTTSSRGPS